MLVVVAIGSRLTLDFPFIDFFGVLQEHILSQFFFFRCVSISINLNFTDRQTHSQTLSFVQSKLGKNQSGQVRTGRDRSGQVRTGRDGSGQVGTG